MTKDATVRIRRFGRRLGIAAALASAGLRAELQYRANFMMVLAGLVYQSTGFIFIWIVLSRYGGIEGWTTGQVAFLYGLRLTAHACCVVPFNRMLDLETLVRLGDFDRFLLRPFNLLVQLLTDRFWIGSFGDLIGGLVILIAAAPAAGITWSPGVLGYVVFAVLGGALLEASVQTAIAALSFRVLSTASLRGLIDTLFSTFGNYPLSLFGRVGELVLTYVLPLAFVAYVPATVLLGREGEVPLWRPLTVAAPVVGWLSFLLAYRIWNRQVAHYQSGGH
jgi:ABC-2 type transport system permease protein